MRSLRIHILQPSEKTPPGAITEWAKSKNHDVKIVRLFTGEALPKLEETDWLIILGGRMGVSDVADYPWINDVKALLKDSIRAQKTGLGICLGAQLYAEALGGKVRRNDHWEVGWHPVQIGAPNSSMNTLKVFQHHQDTFDLPPSAVRIATNEIARNQGFAMGDRVVALQFHPEATPEWIQHECNDPDYPTGPHVQSPTEILSDTDSMAPMRKWFFTLLDRLEVVAARPV
ncbi:MAG: type 1 glutamine amidotransferase [Bdellovibrionota bacterium]